MPSTSTEIQDSTPARKSPKSVLGFMGLPPELRIEIYKYYIANLPDQTCFWFLRGSNGRPLSYDPALSSHAWAPMMAPTQLDGIGIVRDRYLDELGDGFGVSLEDWYKQTELHININELAEDLGPSHIELLAVPRGPKHQHALMRASKKISKEYIDTALILNYLWNETFFYLCTENFDIFDQKSDNDNTPSFFYLPDATLAKIEDAYIHIRIANDLEMAGWTAPPKFTEGTMVTRFKQFLARLTGLGEIHISFYVNNNDLPWSEKQMNDWMAVARNIYGSLSDRVKRRVVMVGDKDRMIARIELAPASRQIS